MEYTLFTLLVVSCVIQASVTSSSQNVRKTGSDNEIGKMDVLQREMDTLKAKVDQMDAMHEEMDFLKTKVNQMDAMQGEMDALKAKMNILDTEVNNLKDENNKLQNQVNNWVKGNISVVNEKLLQCQSDIRKFQVAQNYFVSFTSYATETRNYNADQRVEFDGVVRNYGGHYDNFTSVFTCPTKGYYLFMAFFCTESINIRASIRVNGIKLVSSETHTNYDSAANAVISLCETGQAVDVVCTKDGDWLFGNFEANRRYSTFSGSLLQVVVE